MPTPWRSPACWRRPPAAGAADARVADEPLPARRPPPPPPPPAAPVVDGDAPVTGPEAASAPAAPGPRLQDLVDGVEVVVRVLGDVGAVRRRPEGEEALV